MVRISKTSPGTPAKSPFDKPVLPEKSLTSKELFQNGKTIVIKHAGEEYRMNITSKDKLILIK
jgi:hemin uptake protein HemP